MSQSIIGINKLRFINFLAEVGSIMILLLYKSLARNEFEACDDLDDVEFDVFESKISVIPDEKYLFKAKSSSIEF